MLVPFKNSKSYGVIHTENYFSFLGFSKKVNSDEIQKVDIYLDDMLIDTITADKHIEKIEDIYELESFGFEYVLPNEYIGQKSLISFKNHETKEHLQNSPYELITNNHPKFNECLFLNSISNKINEEKVRNQYCSNSIGFLAIEENLNDIFFIDFIKEIITKFPNCKIKAMYFNFEQKKLCEEIFSNINITLLELSSIFDLVKNIEVYIHNTNCSNSLVIWKTQQILIYQTPEIFVSSFNLELFNLTLKVHSSMIMKKGFPYYDSPHSFGFSDSDVKLSNGNVHKLISSKIPDNENFKIDLSKTLRQYFFDQLNIILKNNEYKRYLNMSHTIFKKVMEQNND